MILLMTKISKMRKTILLSTMVLTLSIGLASPAAFAAEGDIVGTVTCAGPEGSVGLAYDGTSFYWPRGVNVFTLGTCDTAAVVGPDLPIIGLSDGISTVAYDATRDLLWAATSDLGGEARDIYQIDKTTGDATFIFTAIATGASFTDGLAYDGEDDSIWITGDVSSVISHYETDGTVIGIDIPIDGPPFAVSGVAAGVDVLYLGHDGLTVITKHAKSDLELLATFPTGGGRTEELECDPDTFPGIDVLWSKDLTDFTFEAYEVADGTCPIGGGGNGTPTAGELLSIDSAALMIAGLQSSAIWMLPILAGAVGTGAYIVRSKLK